MQDLERILVVRLRSMSDIVNATPLLGALREQRPRAYLTMVVLKEYEDLFSGHPWVDSVIAFDRRRLHRGPLGFLRLLREVRAQRWDIAIDLQGTTQSASLARASGAALRLRVPTPSALTRLMVSTRASRYFARRTAVEDVLRVLKRLDIGEGYRPPRLFVRPEWANAARGLFKQLGVKSSAVVGMAPGARWETTMWPVDRYAEVARRLSCAGSEVLMLGSLDEKDLCSKAAAGRAGIYDLAGRLTLGEFLGVLSLCTAYVGNDTGPTHCAQALGVPTVALFGPTDGRRFVFSGGRPLQRTVPCGPCSIRGRQRCPTGDHACMLGIPVDDVLKAVSQVLPPPQEPEGQPLHW